MQEAIRIQRQKGNRKFTPAELRRLSANKAFVHARNVLDATELIRLGARVPLVCNLTRIRKATARSLYRQIRGVPSTSGQAPFTDTWYLKSDRRQLHANLIWRLFEGLLKSTRSDARILIDLYDSYLRIVQTPIVTIERAAFVPKLVALCFWQEGPCRECGLPYITPTAYLKDVCPGCRLYHRHYRRRRAARSTAL